MKTTKIRRTPRRQSHVLRLQAELLENRTLLTSSNLPALLLLDPTGKGALNDTGNGGVVVTGGGSVVIDSANSQAAVATGKGNISASEFDITGSPGYVATGSGKFLGTIHSGATLTADPLLKLPTPSAGSPTFAAVNYSGNMPLLLSPGTYVGGIKISGQGPVTLLPGIYYLQGGGFSVTGPGSVSGSGVMIYNAPQAGGDAISFTGSGNVQFSPPTSGTYQNITIFQNRTSTVPISLTSSGNLDITGTIYAPGAMLKLTGDGGQATPASAAAINEDILADLTLTGNGGVQVDATYNNPLTLTLSLSPAPTLLTGGTLVTKVAQSTVQGTTKPGATVALEIGTGGVFNAGQTTADTSGHFSIPVTLAQGSNLLQVQATSRYDQQVTVPITVVLDTQPPTISVSSPAANGFTNSAMVTGLVTDNLSGVASLQGEVDGGSFAPVSFDALSHFSFNTGLAVGGAADGPHTAYLKATDQAGNVSSVTSLPFNLKTRPPTIPAFDLAAGTADLGPEDTSAAHVTLVGQSDANVTLSLVGTVLTAITSGTGGFQIPGVNLALGSNTLTVQATDQAGNTSSYALNVTRGSVPPGQSNPVIVWNQATLNAIQTDGTDPLMTSRALAMVQAAVFDSVNTIEGTPAYYVKVTAPADASVAAAVDAAAHDVLGSLYPAQQATFDALLATELALLPAGQGTTDGETVGQAVGNAIIALRTNDGSRAYVDFIPGTAAGDWQPTAPAYAKALDPQGANMTPWALTSANQFDPAGPPALTSQQWADAVNQVEGLGAVNSTMRTSAETTLAQFWNDGIGTDTPSGHWNAIAQTVAQQEGESLADDARLFAELDISMADASIATWNTKYLYDTWRPITVIQSGGNGGNPDVTANPTWTSFLTNPNFPEYVSGHSAYSMAAATVLDSFFGDNVTFTTTEPTTTLSLTYTSFDQAAEDAGMSRLYGGIHFLFSIQDGWTVGQDVANWDLATFNVSKDTTPPKVTLNNVLPSGASKTNVTITGQATDNLSGVATLQVQVDTGAYVPLAFDPTTGVFSFTTSFALDGSADGSHTIDFQATDAAGNVATPVAFTFTLDTKTPTLTLTSPTNGGTLAAGATLTGTVTTNGAALVALSYSFDGGTSMPVAFSPDGSFSQALDLSKLTPGDPTLVVTAQDAAGNTTTQTLNLTLPTAIPLTVTSITPSTGSSDVSVTFRPAVFFSRPIDPTSLNSSNFYATDTTGTPIPATIAPADDGLSALLFFTNPLPSSSTITLTVNGATIKAADGTLLDAAGTGTPGSTLTSTFITVSTAAVLGTTITGIVADPGADGQPGTRDDVRSGADGVLGTADDVYLNPIAGATVYVLGMQEEAITSGADGSFTLTSVPTGDVKLVIDGRTATNAPSGVFYPEMVLDLTIQPGVVNTVMGSMGTTQQQAAQGLGLGVYLPRLQSSILKPAGGATATTISLDPDAATSTLTAEQASEYSITVAPDSLVGMDGLKMSSGMVGFSTVQPSLIREMLPEGVMQLATTLTIQAPGVATFSTPLVVTFANVYGAAPGTQLDVYSFNHTTGLLEITGTATVSADGKTVTTDPGSGITHPGWFGVTPPGSQNNPLCPPNMPHPVTVTPSVPPPSGLKDTFFKDDSDAPLDFTISNKAQPLNPSQNLCGPTNSQATPLEVNISVDDSDVASEFLDGFKIQPFELEPGQQQTVVIKPLTLLSPQQLVSYTNDVLFGVSIHVTAYPYGQPSDLLLNQTVYVYRFLDISDATHGDGEIDFEKTLADGHGVGVARDKLVQFVMGPGDAPSLKPSDSSVDFTAIGGGQVSNAIRFDPAVSNPMPLQEVFKVHAPDGNDPGQIKAVGMAVGPLKLYFSKDEFSLAITQMVSAAGTNPALQAAQPFLGLFPDPNQIVTTSNTIYDQIVANLNAELTASDSAIGNAVEIVDNASGSDGDQVNLYLPVVNNNSVDLSKNTNVSLRGGAGADDILASQFQQQLQPLYDQPKISTSEAEYLFDSYINQSPTDSSIYYGYSGMVLYLDRIAMTLQVKSTANALPAFENLVTNIILHELGHDLGAIHLKDDKNPYVWYTNDSGGEDVMGSGAADTSNLHTYLSIFSPVVKDALGIPLPDPSQTVSQFNTTYNYYENFLKSQLPFVGNKDGYTFNDPLYNKPVQPPPDDGIDLSIGAPFLQVTDGPFDDPSHPPHTLDQVDFGPTIDGQDVTETLYLFNGGDQDLHVSDIHLARVNGDFSVGGISSLPVVVPLLDPDNPQPAASTLAIVVHFDPSRPGTATNSLEIDSDTIGGAPIVIPLTGVGSSPSAQIDVQVADNDMGGVSLGDPTAASQVVTITDSGSQPLTVTSILAAGAGYAVNGLPANLGPSDPIVIEPGQSFSFNAAFLPVQTSLQRGQIVIISNDPDTSSYALHLTGTGIPASGTLLHYAHDYVAIEFPDVSGDPILRTVSDASGNFKFFMPPDTYYHYAIFDPISGLIANGYGTTAASGQPTTLTTPVFAASTTFDTDGDGLPDDVEFAIGTSPTNAFTAGDGIDDFTHVIVDQTSPTGLVPLTTGVIATLPLSGNAQDVTLVGSTTSPTGQTAYVANGSSGLAIVNASNFQKPVVLGQLPLAGNSTGVAVDSNLQVAAVASSSALYLVNVSNPTHPTLIKTVNVAALAVKVYDGVAYAANGNQVTAVDMLTGQVLAQESFSGGSLNDLGIDQGNLYVLASAGFSSHTVYKVVLNGSGLPAPVYSLVITGHPTFGRMYLFAGGGYVYVGASDNNNTQEVPGVEVIQDTGTSLTYVGPSTAITAFNVTANGNGLALFAGGLQFSAQVGLLDLSDPTVTNKVITTFNTSGTAHTIAIGEGIAFVADGSAGLAVLNYLPFDTKGVAPTVFISTSAPDKDLITPGLQVFAGSTLPINVTATDDVQVRNVELLVNGQVVQNAVSFPFNLSAIAPAITGTSSSFTVQVLATDTGGNVGASSILTIGLIADTSPPTITSFTPASGSSTLEGPQTVQITFSKVLAAATVTAANFQLKDASGNVIAPTNLGLRNSGTLVQLTYPTLLAGAYTLVINGPAVTDTAGNPLSTGNVTDSFTLTPRETLTVANADGDPVTSGLQLYEAVTVTGTVAVNSSVSVQSVALLLNGQVISTSATAPLNYSFIAPLLSAGASSFTLQARVTDTSGVVTTSSVLTVGLLKDITPPSIVSTSPANGSSRIEGPQTVSVTFSEALASATVTAANFQLKDAGGNVIAPTSIGLQSNATVVAITYPTLPAGSYQLVINGPAVTDRVGHPLGTGNVTDSFTLTPRATVTTTITDADPNTPGLQTYEETTIPLTVTVVSGVSVQSVALLVNGQSVATLSSAPYSFSYIAPSLASGVNALSIQAQVTDTAGVSTTTPVLSIGLLRDLTPPTIVSTLPANGSVVSAGLQSLTVTFSKPLARSTISTTNFTLLSAGPDGVFGDSDDVTIPITGLQFLTDDTQVQLSVAALAAGSYQLSLRKDGVTDRVGNALGTGTFQSSFSTVAQVLQNGGFESGNFTGWTRYGFTGQHLALNDTNHTYPNYLADQNAGTSKTDTNAVVKQQTSTFDGIGISSPAVNPTQGSFLAFLSNETSAGDGSLTGSAISQTFTVPAGATTLSFDVQFLSHEGLNTQWDFGGVALVKGNTLGGTLLAQLNLDHDPGLSTSAANVHTSATPAGDFNDSTGWLSKSFSLSGLAGQVVTVVAYVTNTEDMIEESRLLLDNVQVNTGGSQPQFFAGEPKAPAPGTPDLTEAQLQPVVTQAITQLAAAGYNVSGLGQVPFHIAALAGSLLGLTYQNTIWIAPNAAGYGWYIDASPSSNAAFTQVTGTNELQAAPGSPAYGLVDLLTVVTHELGHVLGFASIDPDVLDHDWMTATLGTGTRRFPDAARGSALPSSTPQVPILSAVNPPTSGQATFVVRSISLGDKGTGGPAGRSSDLADTRYLDLVLGAPDLLKALRDPAWLAEEVPPQIFTSDARRRGRSGIGIVRLD